MIFAEAVVVAARAYRIASDPETRRRCADALDDALIAYDEHVKKQRGVCAVVFGGRVVAHPELQREKLNRIHEHCPIGFVVEGDAPGTDRLAGLWAASIGIPYAAVPALWNFHDKAAGSIRNQAMIDWLMPDLAIAFPGNVGTADMTRRVERAGIPLIKVERE